MQTYDDNSVFEGSEKLFNLTEAFKRDNCFRQCSGMEWADVYEATFDSKDTACC